jgi:lipoyl(octanoyl) transferase
MPTYATRWLGRLDYAAGLQAQHYYAAQRAADTVPDTLLLLEHTHTYTLGTAADRANILLSAEELTARGVQVHQTDRGGDVTYHGPGQLVAYPIRKLPAAGDGLHADVIGYVRSLEEALIETLAAFGLHSARLPGYPGVWVEGDSGPAKIAALGVRINTRRVTTHGVALNIAPDMSYFAGIVPCGLHGKAVTSIEAHLGAATPSLAAVAAQFTACFERVFAYEAAEIGYNHAP